MTRSVGSTIEASLALKHHIHALGAQGLSLSRIASQVGKSRPYVSRVLKQDISNQTRKAEALQLCEQLKRSDESRYDGPERLADRLVREHGFSPDEIPHSQAIHQRLKAKNLTTRAVGTRSDSRSYHVYFKAGLTQSCQNVQVDGAGPFRIAGQMYYIFVAQDRYSRLLYAEIVPHSYGASLQKFARNLIDYFGVPVQVQLDNAVTWRCQPSQPGKLVWSLLSLGVQRIHFIPEAQPTRNGGVERQVYTIKHEFLRLFETETGFTFTSIDHARSELAAFLQRYNYNRQHTALPKRPGNRRFHLTPGEVHTKRQERASPGQQCIAFSRFMSSGYAVLHSSVVACLPDLSERYATWECWLDGTGCVLHRDERTIVGTFQHNFTGKHPDCKQVIISEPTSRTYTDSSGCIYQADALQYAKRILAATRHTRPRVSRLPAGWRLQTDADGGWRLYDADGELVVDHLNQDADHINEFISSWEEAA